MKARNIFICIMGLLAVLFILRSADMWVRKTNHRYMMWRFFSAGGRTQSEMIDDVMNAANNVDIERLNKYLSTNDNIFFPVYAKAVFCSVRFAEGGNIQYMPFITNVLLNTNNGYGKRMFTLREVLNAQLNNRYILLHEISKHTNDELADVAQTQIEAFGTNLQYGVQ